MTRLRVTLLTFHPVLQSSFVPTTLTTQMITRTEIPSQQRKTAYINRYNTVALIGQTHSNSNSKHRKMLPKHTKHNGNSKTAAKAKRNK